MCIRDSPKRIRQILIILVDNAIKFTPPNGMIHVRARLDEDPQFVALEVSDSGCGISPEMTERVFDRLFQLSDPSATARKGLGLGLHICKAVSYTHLGPMLREQRSHVGLTCCKRQVTHIDLRHKNYALQNTSTIAGRITRQEQQPRSGRGRLTSRRSLDPVTMIATWTVNDRLLG